MSYLTGPLTRGQIKTLMDPKRGEFRTVPTNAGAVANPMSMPGLSSPAEETTKSRPLVGNGVKELFVPISGGAEGIIYQPHLLRVGQVHFSSTKTGVDGSRMVRLVNPITATSIDWDSQLPPPLKLEEMLTEPAAGAAFGELPGFAMNAANYKQVEKEFAEWLYRNERADLFTCPTLKEWSALEESEADFRARLSHEAREARDAAIDKLRDGLAKKFTVLDSRQRTAEAQLAKQKAEANAANLQAGVSVLGGILGAVFGRKAGLGSLTRGGSAISKAGTAYKQHQDVNSADEKVEGIVAEKEALQKNLEAEIAKITAAYDPANLTLETEALKPARTDVKVVSVMLLWVPFDSKGNRVG